MIIVAVTTIQLSPAVSAVVTATVVINAVVSAPLLANDYCCFYC